VRASSSAVAMWVNHTDDSIHRIVGIPASVI
jgi:hypothetical protein